MWQIVVVELAYALLLSGTCKMSGCVAWCVLCSAGFQTIDDLHKHNVGHHTIEELSRALLGFRPPKLQSHHLPAMPVDAQRTASDILHHNAQSTSNSDLCLQEYNAFESVPDSQYRAKTNAHVDHSRICEPPIASNSVDPARDKYVAPIDTDICVTGKINVNVAHLENPGDISLSREVNEGGVDGKEHGLEDQIIGPPDSNAASVDINTKAATNTTRVIGNAQYVPDCPANVVLNARTVCNMSGEYLHKPIVDMNVPTMLANTITTTVLNTNNSVDFAASTMYCDPTEIDVNFSTASIDVDKANATNINEDMVTLRADIDILNVETPSATSYDIGDIIKKTNIENSNLNIGNRGEFLDSTNARMYNSMESGATKTDLDCSMGNIVIAKMRVDATITAFGTTADADMGTANICIPDVNNEDSTVNIGTSEAYLDSGDVDIRIPDVNVHVAFRTTPTVCMGASKADYAAAEVAVQDEEELPVPVLTRIMSQMMGFGDTDEDYFPDLGDDITLIGEEHLSGNLDLFPSLLDDLVIELGALEESGALTVQKPNQAALFDDTSITAGELQRSYLDPRSSVPISATKADSNKREYTVSPLTRYPTSLNSVTSACFNAGNSASFDAGNSVSLNRGDSVSLNRGDSVSLNRGDSVSLNRGDSVSLNERKAASLIERKSTSLNDGKFAPLSSENLPVVLTTGKSLFSNTGKYSFPNKEKSLLLSSEVPVAFKTGKCLTLFIGKSSPSTTSVSSVSKAQVAEKHQFLEDLQYDSELHQNNNSSNNLPPISIKCHKLPYNYKDISTKNHNTKLLDKGDRLQAVQNEDDRGVTTRRYGKDFHFAYFSSAETNEEERLLLSTEAAVKASPTCASSSKNTETNSFQKILNPLHKQIDDVSLCSKGKLSDDNDSDTPILSSFNIEVDEDDAISVEETGNHSYISSIQGFNENSNNVNKTKASFERAEVINPCVVPFYQPAKFFSGKSIYRVSPRITTTLAPTKKQSLGMAVGNVGSSCFVNPPQNQLPAPRNTTLISSEVITNLLQKHGHCNKEVNGNIKLDVSKVETSERTYFKRKRGRPKKTQDLVSSNCADDLTRDRMNEVSPGMHTVKTKSGRVIKSNKSEEYFYNNTDCETEKRTSSIENNILKIVTAINVNKRLELSKSIKGIIQLKNTRLINVSQSDCADCDQQNIVIPIRQDPQDTIIQVPMLRTSQCLRNGESDPVLLVMENRKRYCSSTSKCDIRYKALKLAKASSANKFKYRRRTTKISTSPSTNIEQAAVCDENVESSSFICYLCDRDLTSQASLDEHLKSAHADWAKTYSCRCGADFDTEIEFRYHWHNLHLRVYQTTYTCQVCKCNFNREHAYNKHLSIIHPEYRATCYVCEQKFKNICSLRNHMSVHNKRQLFVCPYCPQTFWMRYSFNKHFRNHFNSFSCNLCNKSYKQKHNYKAHLENHKTGRSLGRAPKLQCDSCGDLQERAFVENLHFIDSGHHKVCIKCNKGSYKGYSLGNNFCAMNDSSTSACEENSENGAVHRNSNYSTISCSGVPSEGFETTSHGKLAQNYDRNIDNSNESTRMRTECPHCSTVVLDVAKHIRRVHRQGKVYCDICGALLKKECLRSHKDRLHSRVSDIRCDHCNKVFKSSTSLKEHLRRINSKIKAVLEYID